MLVFDMNRPGNAGVRLWQADTVRVNVAAAYRTRSWQTIEIALGPGSGQLIDFIDPQVAGASLN